VRDLAYDPADTRLLSLASLLAALLAALIAAWLPRQSATERFGRGAGRCPTAAGLLSSEIARLRLLPMALGERSMWQPLTSGDSAAQDRLNRKLERVAHDAGAAVIYGAPRWSGAAASTGAIRQP
jgi:two-component system C4-dicarboxylate transport sensor histidine kinase DctB